MKTYTVLQDYYSAIISHAVGLSLTVYSLVLVDGVYTITCDAFDEEQYVHLHEQYGLTEVN